MGQTLHPSATTTRRTRKEIQDSEKTLKELASTFNISYSTALKWKNREYVEDVKSGRKKGGGSVLTQVEERIICEVRAKTWLALDDLYQILKPHIPLLSRSNLHRCLQRNGINRTPATQGERRAKQEFKKYELTYVHIDTYDVKAGKEKHYSFVAVNHCSQVKRSRRKRPAWGASFAEFPPALVRPSQAKALSTSGYSRFHINRFQVRP